MIGRRVRMRSWARPLPTRKVAHQALAVCSAGWRGTWGDSGQGQRQEGAPPATLAREPRVMRAWVLLAAVLWYLTGGGGPPPGLPPAVGGSPSHPPSWLHPALSPPL